jgi:hypothetical protein
MKSEDLIEMADRLINIGNDVLKTSFTDAHHTVWVSHELFGEFRSSTLSFLRKVFGENHPHYLEFNKLIHNYKAATMWGIGIIKAAKSEIESGWLISLKGIVSAEVFTNFLEMAEYLLAEGYKDASAVMIGSVLEQHLKELAVKNDIDITRVDGVGNVIHLKADFLNAELAKANVYGKLDHKNTTAWLDLRNKAAHGNYDYYNIEQVRIMSHGVCEFIARTRSNS